MEVRRICEEHDFDVSFHYVFRDGDGRAEIDVVAERFDLILCIDAKKYGEKRYRTSQLRREAEKHVERCRRFERLVGRKCVPVIVSFIDDNVYSHAGCLIVPFHAFNEFLANIHHYLAVLGYL